MQQRLLDNIANLQDAADLLKHAFVGRDELIEIMITCAVAQEHLLIIGPPGTAKSELGKRFSMLCSPERETSRNGTVPYFEYLFTRFTEPNEIFGPIDIKGFQAGTGHRRITDGMLPRAEIAFLDEVFKSNSAILNALLGLLNERIFYNGGRPESVPMILAIGAANEVPEDPTLAALYDRFLVRVWTDNVEESQFGELFQRGWKLEKQRILGGYKLTVGNVTTTDALRELYQSLPDVNLDKIARDYRELVRRIRAEGIDMSDRRVIKLLKLVSAATLRRNSLEANPGDFWVLKHIWNNPDQIPHLQTIVDPYLEDYGQARWSAERSLIMIDNDLTGLNARHKELRTDADYADFLQQAEQVRRELLQHSDEAGSKALLVRIKNMIGSAMELLEQRT